MKVETRIKQSAIRVKSNIKLGLFFLFSTLVAVSIGIVWLSKICGVISIAAFLGASLEYWNAVRLRKKANS